VRHVTFDELATEVAQARRALSVPDEAANGTAVSAQGRGDVPADESRPAGEEDRAVGHRRSLPVVVHAHARGGTIPTPTHPGLKASHENTHERETGPRQSRNPRPQGR